MTIDIDKLRAAHAAAMKGPWKVIDYPGNLSALVHSSDVRLVSGCFYKPDADFIALAHNEFPAILDEIERLREEVEAHKDRAQSLMRSEAKRFNTIRRLRALLSRTVEVFNDACNCGECGPCKLREEIEGELK